MRRTLLEARIQRLEDIEAIKDLMARYARLVDCGWRDLKVEADRLTDVYTDDIEWDVVNPDGSVNPDMGGQGIDNLIEEVKAVTMFADFTMHSHTNPIIRVDGDSATGDWLMWIMGTGGEIVSQSFVNLDVTYRRTAQGWRMCKGRLYMGRSIRAGSM